MSNLPSSPANPQISGAATAKQPTISNGWLSPDGFLKLIQTLAILCAGAWALLQYLTYQREHQKVDNATASFTLQQSEKDALVKSVQAQYAADQAKVKQAQDELALKLTGLNVTEKNIDLLMKQLQEQDATKKEELALQASKLDVAKRTSDLAITSMNYRQATSTSFTGEDTLVVSKIQDIDSLDAEFEVTTGYTIKNNSLNDLEVSAVVVQCFLASVDVQNQASGTTSVVVVPIDLPPNLFNPDHTLLNWTRIYSAAYMYSLAGPNTQRLLQSHNLQYRLGGAVTGVWRHDDGYSFHEFFILHAPKRSILGCSQNVVTNDGAEQYDYTYYVRNEHLWSKTIALNE